MKLIEQIQSYLNWIDERDEMPEWMDGSEWCEILDVSETWEFVLLRMAKEKIIQLEAELDATHTVMVKRGERAIKLRTERDALAEGLQEIIQWCNAYPLSIFPEPDLKKAHELLKAGGITLDAISASSMRHVLKGIVKIIEATRKEVSDEAVE